MSEIADSKASFEGDLAVKSRKLKMQSTSKVGTYDNIFPCKHHIGSMVKHKLLELHYKLRQQGKIQYRWQKRPKSRPKLWWTSFFSLWILWLFWLKCFWKLRGPCAFILKISKEFEQNKSPSMESILNSKFCSAIFTIMAQGPGTSVHPDPVGSRWDMPGST